MRIHPPLLIASLVCLGLPAAAQAQKPPARPPAHPPAHPPGHPPAHPAAASAPKKLGTYGDWIAATHEEAGATVCYAFTYAAHSVPKLPDRGEVVLTVAERPTGRDDVALSAGFAYAAGAAVTVQVDQTGLDFYTAQPQPGRNAFARDGKAAIAAFEKGSEAQARSPAAKGAQVVDTFPLRGFSAAYAAISKACPPK